LLLPLRPHQHNVQDYLDLFPFIGWTFKGSRAFVKLDRHGSAPSSRSVFLFSAFVGFSSPLSRGPLSYVLGATRDPLLRPLSDPSSILGCMNQPHAAV